LDLTGLVNRISFATISIDSGRKGFAIRGKEQEGRILFETGVANAMLAFLEAQFAADPQAIILAEYTFLTQEFQLCDKSDKIAINSLTKAIQHFDDAFLALKEVEGSNYKTADNVIPHNKDYREKGYPKDSFHIACNSHKARIKNILSATGIDPIEKNLLKQRRENLYTAQNAYIEKQKKALGNKIHE
jgi:hypothetical protein